MIFKSVVLALFGITLVLANPVQYGNFEVEISQPTQRPKHDAREIIEIDETNDPNSPFIDQFAGDKEKEPEVTAFSTPKPTPEPDVSEEELPDDVKDNEKEGDKTDESENATKSPVGADDHLGIKGKLGNWLGEVGQKWKEHVHKDKEVIQNIWGSLTNKWSFLHI